MIILLLFQMQYQKSNFLFFFFENKSQKLYVSIYEYTKTENIWRFSA
jgi:hypothetical protein